MTITFSPHHCLRGLTTRRYHTTGPVSVVAILLLLGSHLCAQEDSDTPEDPVLGAPRILESQTFVGRFDELDYENYGAYDYPRATCAICIARWGISPTAGYRHRGNPRDVMVMA